MLLTIFVRGSPEAISHLKRHRLKSNIIPDIKSIKLRSFYVVVEPEPIVEEPKKDEPIEISEEKVMNTKFTMSLQTLGALVAVVASGIGGYYMLLQEIEEAKNLPEPPSIESIFGDEYPSKPDGHNWPRSYEQYKTQVGGLQKDMGDVFDIIEEYDEKIEELEKLVSNLRVEVARKKDK